MTKTTHTDDGGIRHKGNCSCDLCEQFSEDDGCSQCGGPVRPVEFEMVVSVRCRHCGASRAIPKADPDD